MANYNRKDHLHQKAKSEGYRSRAAYKLLELQKKYKIIKPGDIVYDLGAWPGGWAQVASKLVGNNGLVVAIDLTELEPFKETNVITVQSDIADYVCTKEPSVIVSDMSAKLTGIRDADIMNAERVCELAFSFSKKCLKKDGTLVMKLFPGVEDFIKREIKPAFKSVQRTELDSSRSTSKESYLVAKGFL